MKKIMLLLAAALAVAPAASFAQKMTVTNINREKTYQTSTHNVDIWYEGELNLGFATGGKLKWDDGEKDKTNYSRPFISTIHGARITNTDSWAWASECSTPSGRWTRTMTNRTNGTR